ncbi:Spo0E family sporulation regulatory protein-aspartic acid phosphatase [Ornithinibacillus sp. L9]|uniref:Spo0E family sporulation regulatory protein-aspartic acid phosphatase n=1 Tax=Ornithinibacillus caprae TaxID=2678566 RepID=A0A6N8FE23_9BACI|nr:aspartyl-phosphate phosphatase Spo0E family protein [Ornithinibacillus caprae]MUK87922.1 Spo0E family sporulation regulatory protein-aspartic acid phosphatase [Ornithinibacillus caprae]
MVNKNKDELLNQVQKKKKEMIEIGLEKGLQHDETLLISQQLDKLIFKAQKQQVNKPSEN